MSERKNLITMHGKSLTLLGNEIKEGMNAPDFTAIDNSMNPVTLSSFKGKPCLLITVPSLDTPVCSIESRKFNQEVAKWGDQVTTLVISADLPFAQKRWCGAEGIKNLQTLSDYRDREVGQKYGVLIKELYLLARAVFVIDQKGIIRNYHLVKEVTQEPNYTQVLQEVSTLLSSAKR